MSILTGSVQYSLTYTSVCNGPNEPTHCLFPK
ncbi:unnamed protein product [Chironomus riparius]|uniref:Uncharacterized protein n=1 Tax=Chironomus riparius TaxID=315576 RepID=A0A9N9WN69_9DIPT|nr:unnamed protein product [Chironomus riparius]